MEPDFPRLTRRKQNCPINFPTDREDRMSELDRILASAGQVIPTRFARGSEQSSPRLSAISGPFRLLRTLSDVACEDIDKGFGVCIGVVDVAAVEVRDQNGS